MATSLQRDANYVAVGGGVLDDGSKVIAPISIAAATGRLKVTAIVSGLAGGFQQPVSGAVDGSNQTFIWASAPKAIVVDQGRTMQKINNGDSFVNWTGTTTTVLTIAPNSDIFAIG